MREAGRFAAPRSCQAYMHSRVAGAYAASRSTVDLAKRNASLRKERPMVGKTELRILKQVKRNLLANFLG